MQNMLKNCCLEAGVRYDIAIIGNKWIRRILKKDGGVWRTVLFERGLPAEKLPVASEEFRITLMDGTVIGLDDYSAPEAPLASVSDGQAVIEIRYGLKESSGAEGAPSEISVCYRAGEEPCMRKTLKFEVAGGEVVDRLEVERFRAGLPCEAGGIGQPVFIGGKWFAGLEYPGGYADYGNGLITLAHYPAPAKRSDDTSGSRQVVSKKAVTGTGAGDTEPIAAVFREYLESVRQPAPAHVLANPGSKNARGMSSVKQFLDFFDGFKDNLEPFDVSLDSLQLDLIGFEPCTVAEPRGDLFPGGYGELCRLMRGRGSSLSVWLSLNGTGILYDVWKDGAVQRESEKWMAEQGYRRTDGPFQPYNGHYCASTAGFKDAMKDTIRKAVEDGITYFKHDYIQGICSAEGHGHLPSVRHGFEANMDAVIEMLDYARRLNPDIINAPTSYAHLSPWWLMHANYIWYGASDSGAVSTWPQLSSSEWELNYKDGHFYKMQNRWKSLVPMTAMNTQAFMRHSKTKDPDSKEPLREWADYCMMVCGRGLRLIDLYFNPVLRPDFWKALGESLRWWRHNVEILGNTRMAGGDPRKGEVYGYVHWKDDSGIICLRNPDIKEQTISVPFDTSVSYGGQPGRLFRGRVIYPFLEDIPVQFESGKPLLLKVPGYSVAVVELSPGKAPDISPAVPEGDIEGRCLAEFAGGMTPYGENMKLSVSGRVKLPREEMERCGLFFIAGSNGALPDITSVKLNGKTVEATKAEGQTMLPGDAMTETDTAFWSLVRVDLKEHAGKILEIEAETSRNPVPFTLDVWVAADRPVKDYCEGGENLPPGFWRGFRRQTVNLMSYRLSVTPLHHM